MSSHPDVSSTIGKSKPAKSKGQGSRDPNKGQGSKDPNKGQISILVVLSLIPLFTLLAFTVNVGMMVHAKISLQNAADMAAYAGAATQARQMTGISHLNYMLRQAYKRFLYRYYVVGNYALKCFPHPNGATDTNPSAPPSPNCPTFQDPQAFDWLNPGGQQFPGMPAVCMDLSANSNPCQLGDPLMLVNPPQCLPMDPACAALVAAASSISNIQQLACGAHKLMNFEVLAQWMYSPSFTGLVNSQTALNPLVDGMGLVPENLLNYARITTLQGYINEAPKTIKNLSDLNRLETLPDQAKGERTILAYKSAIGNLNANVFNEGVTMTELQPQIMLNLKKIQPEIEAASVLFESSGSSCGLGLTTLPMKPVLGVYKEPAKDDAPDVFYAVKLEAKARLLFNPFPIGSSPDTGVTLTAYAAAKPFGSRIGPVLKDSDFYKETKAKIDNQVRTVKYPALKISDQYSFESYGVLNALAKIMKTQSGPPSGPTDVIDAISVKRGVLAAQFPDEIEVGQFNVPVDVEQMLNSISGMIRYYGPLNGTANKEPYYRMNQFYQLWAPVAPPGTSESAIKEQVKAEFENNISFSNTGTTSTNAIDQLKVALSADFNSKLDPLFQTLRQMSNYNIAWIWDPLASKELAASIPGGRPSVPGTVSAPQVGDFKLASSYTSPNDMDFYTGGRDGYSVKFIPMQHALKGSRGDGLRGEAAEVQKMHH